MAAGSTVIAGTEVPAGQLWGGSPAKYMRDVKATETEYIPTVAQSYVELGAKHSAMSPKTIEEMAAAALAQLQA